jgi:hypothetical protein
MELDRLRRQPSVTLRPARDRQDRGGHVNPRQASESVGVVPHERWDRAAASAGDAATRGTHGRSDLAGAESAAHGDPQAARRDVLTGRLLMLPTVAIVLLIASGFDNIFTIYKFLAVMMPGPEAALILRWYWWRVSAWSELAAMVTSLAVGWNVSTLESLAIVKGEPDEHFGTRLAITMGFATATWGWSRSSQGPHASTRSSDSGTGCGRRDQDGGPWRRACTSGRPISA